MRQKNLSHRSRPKSPRPSKYIRRVGRRTLAQEHRQIIESDPAVQRYYNYLRSKPRNKGYLSPNSRRDTTWALFTFMACLHVPITSHGVTDLVTTKRIVGNTNYQLEEALETFSNLDPLTTYRNLATRILGVFRANRVPLSLHIDTHLEHPRTEPISEGILAAIYSDLDPELRTLVDLSAYGGERVHAMCTFEPDQVELDTQVAIIHFHSYQTKTRLAHPSIIPRELFERVTSIEKETGRLQPFPNYPSLWKKIAQFSKSKYNVRLTSHYLRKRFFSIAEETPMPVNHWDFLMGSSQRTGHEANVYSLYFRNKLISEYITYLLPRLKLGKGDVETKVESFHETNDLRGDINNLNATIQALTRGVSELNALLHHETNTTESELHLRLG